MRRLLMGRIAAQRAAAAATASSFASLPHTPTLPIHNLTPHIHHTRTGEMADSLKGSLLPLTAVSGASCTPTKPSYRLAPSSSASSSASASGAFLKSMALVVLVLQNSALALIMRYSRTVATEASGGMFLASTAVVLSESIKLLVSTSLVAQGENGWGHAWRRLWHEIVGRPEEMGKLLIPAMLYVVQNNLQYVAVSNLDAATYQVLYQLKILTTALFSAFLLHRRLITKQWLALLLLVGGVALVQLSSQKSNSSSSSSSSGNATLGLISILLACCSSGFAGVYFEKVLKSSNDVSVWVRNVQLALIGIVVGLMGVCSKDAAAVRAYGFFQGYSPIVWTVVCLQALGGIMVALVVKYADSVLKGFATSVSIVVSCLVSLLCFPGDVSLSLLFFLGTALVIGSTILYSSSGSSSSSSSSKAPAVPAAPEVRSASPSMAMVVSSPVVVAATCYPIPSPFSSLSFIPSFFRIVLWGRNDDKQQDDKLDKLCLSSSSSSSSSSSPTSSSSSSSSSSSLGMPLCSPTRHRLGPTAAIV